MCFNSFYFLIGAGYSSEAVGVNLFLSSLRRLVLSVLFDLDFEMRPEVGMAGIGRLKCAYSGTARLVTLVIMLTVAGYLLVVFALLVSDIVSVSFRMIGLLGWLVNYGLDVLFPLQIQKHRLLL